MASSLPTPGIRTRESSSYLLHTQKRKATPAHICEGGGAVAALLSLTTKTEKKISITNLLELRRPNPQPRVTGAGLLMGNNLLTRTRARDTRTRNPVRVCKPVSITKYCP